MCEIIVVLWCGSTSCAYRRSAITTCSIPVNKVEHICKVRVRSSSWQHSVAHFTRVQPRRLTSLPHLLHTDCLPPTLLSFSVIRLVPCLSSAVITSFTMSAAMTADQKLVKQSWQKAYKAALDADIWGQADDAHDNYSKSVALIHRTPPQSAGLALPSHRPTSLSVMCRVSSLAGCLKTSTSSRLISVSAAVRRSAAALTGTGETGHSHLTLVAYEAAHVTPVLFYLVQAHLHKFRQCLALRGEALQASTGAILANINAIPATATAASKPTTVSAKPRPAIRLEQMKKLTRVLDELFTQPAAASDFPIVVPALAVMGKSNKSGGEKIIISPTEEKTQESDEGGSLLPPRQPDNTLLA